MPDGIIPDREKGMVIKMSDKKRKAPKAYCRKKIKLQPRNLYAGAFYLLIGLLIGGYGIISSTGSYEAAAEDQAFAFIIGLLGILAGLYEFFLVFRDMLFPSKSILAKSIRSQLPDSSKSTDVKALFALVDQDIEENGHWFGPAAVGKEWVLGEEASYIPGIRAVFYRNKIKRNRGIRILWLYIMDDRRQVQSTRFNYAKDLEDALKYLKKCVPAAFFGDYSDYLDRENKTDEEWWSWERDFQLRKERLEKKPRVRNVMAMEPDEKVAFSKEGSDDQDIMRMIHLLRTGEWSFLLMQTEQCRISIGTWYVPESQCEVTVMLKHQDQWKALRTAFPIERGISIFLSCYDRGCVCEEFDQWMDVTENFADSVATVRKDIESVY